MAPKLAPLTVLAAVLLAAAGGALAEPGDEDDGAALERAPAILAEEVDGVCFLKRVKDGWESEGRPEVGGWFEGASDEEAEAAYECVKDQLAEGYARSGQPLASLYRRYARINETPERSARHNSHYVNLYLNSIAADHATECASADAPRGAVRITNSFRIRPTGRIVKGPLFVFVKMEEGYDPPNNDWRAQMIMPTGKLRGFTGNKRPSALLHDCPAAVDDAGAATGKTEPGPPPAAGFDAEPESEL